TTVMNHVSRLDVPIIQVGIRSLDEEEAKEAEEAGIISFPAEFEKADLIKETKEKDVYLTIDMDVLDPSKAPGVSNPEPAGLSLNTLMEIVKSIAESSNIVGFDLVEVCPPHDHGNATSTLAAKILLETITVLYKKK
ncbi:arginase family protein, partial [Candidatus Altiarchaeota archaeon]